MRSHVLFIGGRSGVGKTSAASALHELLSARDIRHAVIEGDELDLAHPAPHVAHPDFGLAERNLAAMWQNYRTLGYSRLVFTNTVSVLELERLTQAMGDQPTVTAVLLQADDLTTRSRLDHRANRPASPTEVARSKRSAQELDEATSEHVHRLDTSSRTPAQVAQQLADLVKWH